MRHAACCRSARRIENGLACRALLVVVLATTASSKIGGPPAVAVLVIAGVVAGAAVTRWDDLAYLFTGSHPDRR